MPKVTFPPRRFALQHLALKQTNKQTNKHTYKRAHVSTKTCESMSFTYLDFCCVEGAVVIGAFFLLFPNMVAGHLSAPSSDNLAVKRSRTGGPQLGVACSACAAAVALEAVGEKNILKSLSLHPAAVTALTVIMDLTPPATVAFSVRTPPLYTWQPARDRRGHKGRLRPFRLQRKTEGGKSTAVYIS